MRVVSGSARGRRLVTPAGRAVRPTADRVREALSNALWSMGVLRDAVVVDLFAGSGALGIEALSRGAAHATFVDRSPSSIEAIRANLATCGFADRAEVVRADALDWLRAGSTPVDLAFVDPPYDFDRWQELADALAAQVVVIESDRPVEPVGWEVRRQRRYGGTVVTIVEPTDRDEHGQTPVEDRS